MSPITESLPDRPLSSSEIHALEAQREAYGVAPVGFAPDRDIVVAFVVIVGGERGHSLGFDTDAEQWVVVESFEDGDDFSAVTERLRSWVGDDWDEELAGENRG
ncbi:hypothetical protein [Haloarcula marina]|uniref:hypothetical protein n=1 Tax=Haloarcula marina TaxID=2961574 RepID=UPI0020B816DD|nr:hypothetical protein [Halomicroarcula marina]